MNTFKLSMLLFFSCISVAQSQADVLPSGPSYFYECAKASSLLNFQNCLTSSVDKCVKEQKSIASQCENLQRVMYHGLALTIAESSVSLPSLPVDESTIREPRRPIEKGGANWGYSVDEILLVALGETKLHKLRNKNHKFGQQYDLDIMNGAIFNPFDNLNESQKKSIIVELSPGNKMELNSILTKITEDQDFLSNSAESNSAHALKVQINDPAVRKSIEDSYISQLDSRKFNSASISKELELIQ